MTTKRTPKSPKKVAKLARRRIAWPVPRGSSLLGVHPLGVLGRKIWLEVTIVPET